MLGTTRILMVIEAEIATTHLIEQVLKACSAWGISYQTQFLQKLRATDIGPGVIPLFVRCGDPLALAWTRALVDADYPYAYYIDDNFWRIRGDSALAAYYRHPVTRKSLEFSISNAKAVITNSNELASFLSSFTNTIVVLPTFFDFSLIENIRPTFSEQLRIGFAGSPSRIDDLDLIAPIIGTVLETFPKASFEFAGVLPRGISPNSRIQFFPYAGNYRDYIRFQAERNWAVALAPLIDHESNRSKTDNKYREYSACRYAGIYSNIPPYNSVVRDEVTGLLIANNHAAWLETIANLLEQPAKRAALAQNAFIDVKQKYDIKRTSETWAKFFHDLGAEHTHRLQSGLESVSLGSFVQRRLDAWRLHLAVTYHEGGLPLVMRRLVRKVRALAP